MFLPSHLICIDGRTHMCLSRRAPLSLILKSPQRERCRRESTQLRSDNSSGNQAILLTHREDIAEVGIQKSEFGIKKLIGW